MKPTKNKPPPTGGHPTFNKVMKTGEITIMNKKAQNYKNLAEKIITSKNAEFFAKTKLGIADFTRFLATPAFQDFKALIGENPQIESMPEFRKLVKLQNYIGKTLTIIKENYTAEQALGWVCLKMNKKAQFIKL